MINQRQKEKQELAKQYVKNHNLQKIVGEMLNSVIHAKDDNPKVFMIRYLSKLVPQQVLKKEGIQIKGPKPRTYPMLIYPDFPDYCKSMLKRHLTQNQWQSLRKKKTKHGGNLQFCIRAGTQDFEDQIGVYACDSDAYSRYSAMFMPLIQDLHKQDASSLYLTSSLDASGVQDCHSQIRGYINQIRMTAHRNFSETPFQPLLSHQDRMKIQMRVSEALKKISDADLRGNYFTLSRLPDVGDMAQFLKQNNINLKKTKLLDAAGITENWPDGRGIFISNNKSVFVKVNFQDHVEVIVLGKDGNFSKTLQKMRAILDTIQDEVDPYSQNSKLGYLNASPRNLGHGFEVKVLIGGEAAIRLNHYLEQHENSCKGVDFNLQEPNQQVSIKSIEKFGISEKDILNERILQLIHKSFETPNNANSTEMGSMKTAGAYQQQKNQGEEKPVQAKNANQGDLDDQARSVVSSKKSVAAKFVEEDPIRNKKQDIEQQKAPSIKSNSRPAMGKREDKSQVRSVHSRVQTMKQESLSKAANKSIEHQPAMSEVGAQDQNKGLEEGGDLEIKDDRSEKGHSGMLQKIQSPKKTKASAEEVNENQQQQQQQQEENKQQSTGGENHQSAEVQKQEQPKEQKEGEQKPKQQQSKDNEQQQKQDQKQDQKQQDSDGGQDQQEVVDDVLSKTHTIKGDDDDDEEGEEPAQPQNRKEIDTLGEDQKKEEKAPQDDKKEQSQGGDSESIKDGPKDEEGNKDSSQNQQNAKEA